MKNIPVMQNEKTEELSGFEAFQLARYGNILKEDHVDADDDSDQERSTGEGAYIFDLENTKR